MLKLSFDVTTGNLVPWQGGAVAVPFLRQGKTGVELRFVQPINSAIPGLPAYEPADLAAYNAPRLGIWSDTTFTESDSTEKILALSSDFTLNEDDPDDPFYAGTLDLNTSEVAALPGKTASAYLAVNLVFTADLSLDPIFDHKGAANITLYSATDDGFAALATSATAKKPIPLPLTVIDPDTGEVYELTRTAAGTLTWVWTNPP